MAWQILVAVAAVQRRRHRAHVLPAAVKAARAQSHSGTCLARRLLRLARRPARPRSIRPVRPHLFIRSTNSPAMARSTAPATFRYNIYLLAAVVVAPDRLIVLAAVAVLVVSGLALFNSM